MQILATWCLFEVVSDSEIQFQFCPMDISSVYRLSILGSSTGLPQTSNSLSFAL